MVLAKGGNSHEEREEIPIFLAHGSGSFAWGTYNPIESVPSQSPSHEASIFRSLFGGPFFLTLNSDFCIFKQPQAGSFQLIGVNKLLLADYSVKVTSETPDKVKRGGEMEKEEILEKVYETAKRYELKSGGCAQCTIAAIFEVLSVENEGLFKAATGMADGVGLTGDGHCGALSGGAMAIGYFFGRSKEDFGNPKKQIKACILAKKLHDEFVDQYGTCRCADIQGILAGRFFNLYDPEEIKAAFKAGLPEKCSTLVGKTARLATKIILEEQEAKSRSNP